MLTQRRSPLVLLVTLVLLVAAGVLFVGSGRAAASDPQVSFTRGGSGEASHTCSNLTLAGTYDYNASVCIDLIWTNGYSDGLSGTFYSAQMEYFCRQGTTEIRCHGATGSDSNYGQGHITGVHQLNCGSYGNGDCSATRNIDNNPYAGEFDSDPTNGKDCFDPWYGQILDATIFISTHEFHWDSYVSPHFEGCNV